MTTGPAASDAGDPLAVRHKATAVDGLSVFYREAGDPQNPTLVLLHGFPSSSVMFRDLMPRLARRFHLLAPDYPGFGRSEVPSPQAFRYTFDHLAAVVDQFLEQQGADRYALYLQDYGGPVGFRIALAHPERVRALIVQNAVAHEQGLSDLWTRRRAFWADRGANEAAVRPALSGRHAATARRSQSASRADRPGHLGERVRVSHPARHGGHPTRPLPRLSDQRRVLSAMAGVSPRAAAANPGGVG
jgi:pimeloyl-ACP methyl ester carboxylesterase